MKINPYTAAVQRVHAPSSAVDRVLYTARTNTFQKYSPFNTKRLVIAASFILLTICTFILYGIFVAPSAVVYLESVECVKITLNSRGNVLSADGAAASSGVSAEKAVRVVVEEMLYSGALTAEENTLLLGTENLSEDVRTKLTEAVKEVFADSRFNGAIVSLSCSENGAKAAVIDLLLQQDESLTRSRLLRLNVTELNQLLHLYVPEGVQLLGEPAKSLSQPKKTVSRELPTDPVPTEQKETALPSEPRHNAESLQENKPVIQNNPSTVPEATAADVSQPASDVPTVTAPTEINTVPSAPAPTEQIQESALYFNIPYEDQIPSDVIAFQFGEDVPFTPVKYSFYRRMHYLTLIPAVSKRDAIEMGKSASRIAVFYSYEEYYRYNYTTYGDDTDFIEYLVRMERVNGIDEDYFRENALIMLYYSDCQVIQNEEDRICRIQVSGDIAYVELLRRYSGVLSLEYDVYTPVVSAMVKKSDINDIKQLKLFVEINSLTP